MSDELKAGFNDDLSKTFDTDDLFEKVRHYCPKAGTSAVKQLQPGTVCPTCGAIIQKNG